MNIQQMTYILAIAKYGSFREAARQLFMAQSSLSTSIREVEEEYGIQIFDRTPRGINITTEGHAFLSAIEPIVTRLNALEEQYKASEVREHFSVSSQHYDFVSGAFAKLIHQSAGGEKKWRFRLSETSTKQILEDVSTGFSEMGLLYLSHFNKQVMHLQFREKGLEFHPLFHFRQHVFVGKQHPLAKRERVNLKELQQYPSLNFEQSTRSMAQFSEESLIYESEQSSISVADRETVITILMNTNTCLVGTGILVTHTKDLLATVCVEDAEEHDLGYVVSTKHELTEIAQKFIALMKETIASTEEGADVIY